MPEYLTFDLSESIYIGYPNGTMERFGKKLKTLDNYSLANQSKISFIDPQNRLKIFIFQEDNQSISILDRFSSVPSKYSLQELGFGFIQKACLSPNQYFWLIENNPQVITKFNPLRSERLLETQIQVGDSISCMRAFQNILIISSEIGTTLLDQFGGFIKKIGFKNASHIQVQSDQLILSNGEAILIESLLTTDDSILIKSIVSADRILFIHQNKYLISKKDKLFVIERTNE